MLFFGYMLCNLVWWWLIIKRRNLHKLVRQKYKSLTFFQCKYFTLSSGKKLENNFWVNLPCSPLQEQSFCISCNSHYSYMHGSRKEGKVQYLKKGLHVLQHAIKHLGLFSESISYKDRIWVFHIESWTRSLGER